MNCEIKVKKSVIKTNAQKCKEYRERKKLEEVRVQKKSTQQEIKKPKTDGERSKQYRERQKIKKLNQLHQENIDRLQKVGPIVKVVQFDGLKHLLKFVRKPTMTRAEYMKEYRRKMKLKNLIIRLNGLPVGNHSDAKKNKTGDVQQRSRSERESKKSDSQSEIRTSKQTHKRRIKTNLIEPPRSADDSQSSKDSLLVPIQEEVKRVLPEKYLEVTIKEEVSESGD